MSNTLRTRQSLAAVAAAALVVLAGCSDRSAGDPSAGGPSAGGTTAGGREGDTTEAEPSVLERLRDGGLVVMFRHAATDQSDPDDPVVDLDDCATQRPLDDQGRGQSAAIGEAFRSLDIPVGPVWSSPYCRSRETAELAFGQAEVVDGLERLYPERDADADERTSRLIMENAPRPSDPNLVIVGHGAYPSILAPAVTLAEGEAALYAIEGDEVTHVGTVAADRWATLGDSDSDSDSDSDGAGDGDAAGTGAADEVGPSLVGIERDGVVVGTGFRVALPGIVVTAAELVPDTGNITVVLPDGDTRPADVLGRSSTGVAALALDDQDLPPLHSNDGIDTASPGDRVQVVATHATTGELDTIDDEHRLVATFPATLDTATTTGAPLVAHDGDVLGVVLATTTTTTQVEVVALPVTVARSEVFSITERST